MNFGRHYATTVHYLEAKLVNRMLAINMLHLKQAFAHYASSGVERLHESSKTTTMAPRELVAFVRDCKLLEQGVGAGGNKITSTAVDQIFVKVNYNRKSGTTGDNSIDFEEFLEAVVRLVGRCELDPSLKGLRCRRRRPGGSWGRETAPPGFKV